MEARPRLGAVFGVHGDHRYPPKAIVLKCAAVFKFTSENLQSLACTGIILQRYPGPLGANFPAKLSHGI